MKSVTQFLHKVGDILHLPELPKWLCVVLSLVIILRIPSFFEPYYYGDEMIYLTLGQGVRQGLTLYKDIHDNKPPLLYLMATISENLFWFKAILALWSLTTIIIFYKLSEKIFRDKVKTQRLATIIFAFLTTLPLMEGNTVNAELLMIGPSILAILFLFEEALSTKKVFFAGVLFGIATLFKIPALFDLPIIVFYWLISKDIKRDWREIAKNTSVLIAGFASPILLSLIRYFFRGAFPEYIKAAFMENIGYVSSFRPSDVQKPFLIRNAPLLIRGLAVLAGLVSVYLVRNKISKKFILFSIWTLLALFAITLSERPYPHYFIQAVAPISFLFAMFFTENTFEQSLTVIPLALIFFVPVYYKFYFYPTTSYYARFVKFVTSGFDKKAYFSNFDSTTNRNYEIAKFLSISSRKTDRVFVWDPNSAAIYALARRLPPIKYTVPYHVKDYSSQLEVAKQIEANPPKFIILTAGYHYPELELIAKRKYLLIQQIGNSDIYTRMDLAQ